MIKGVQRLISTDTFSGLSIMGMRGGMLVAKFLLSLFVARYMGLEALGAYGLIVSINGTVQALIRCGVFNTLSREAVHEPKDTLVIHLRNYAVGILVIYLLVVPVAIFIGWHLEMALLFALAAAVMVSEHLAFDIFTLVNNLQRPKTANIMLAVQSALWIYIYIALAFFIPELRTLEMLMCFWVLGGVAMILAALILARHWPWKTAVHSKISFCWYLDHIKRSARLYVSELIGIFNLYADRYLITFFLNLEILGVYVLFSQITNAIHNLVNYGVLQVIKPRLIIACKNKEPVLFHRLYKKGVAHALIGGIAISSACAIVIPFIIPYTNQTMAIEYIPLFWLMLSANIVRIGNDTAKTYLYVSHQDALLLRSNIFGLILCLCIGPPALFFLGIWGSVITSSMVFGGIILYIEWRKIRVG
jgi:O-antigen/teichoic acid export membrane protein